MATEADQIPVKGTAQKMVWPTVCKTITQPYGKKNSIYAKGYHTGLDIGCMVGSPIRAVLDGTVTFAGTNGAYGKQVRLSHNGGAETWYNHLSVISVGKGDKVSQSKILGYEGNTGQSTGPHLHLELRINGQDVDPMPYLKGAALPEGGAVQASTGATQAGFGDVLSAFTNTFEWLTDSLNWLRIGMIALGAALLAAGLWNFDPVRKAAMSVAPVGKVIGTAAKGVK